MRLFLQNKFQVMVIVLGLILILLGVFSLTIALGNRTRINQIYLNKPTPTP